MALADTNVLDLAYAAGVIDSDGCISVSRRIRKNRTTNYVITVSVSMKEDDIPLWFHATFGGALGRQVPSKKPGNSRFCPMWRWQIYCRQSLPFLLAVSPFLKLKKSRAALAIQLLEITKSSSCLRRDSAGRVLPIPDEEVAAKEVIAKKIREENLRTNGRVIFRASGIN